MKINETRIQIQYRKLYTQAAAVLKTKRLQLCVIRTRIMGSAYANEPLQQHAERILNALSLNDPPRMGNSIKLELIVHGGTAVASSHGDNVTKIVAGLL